jgi:lipid II:glycine glycyltransferase (peptidoglycan interpeptide bridge formation enzyme)
MQLAEITDRAAWDRYVAGHDWGHPLQLWAWGQAKQLNDWTPHRLALVDDAGQWQGAVQILLWPIPRLGRFIAYVPRGPVAEPGSQGAKKLIAELVKWAKEHKALYVRIEPAWKTGKPGKGWVKARHHLQLAETYTIDLSRSEEEILEPMNRKHRQYIRKAERDGVTVAMSADVGPMYGLYALTASRAGFGIHSRDYYELLGEELGAQSKLYYAHFNDRPVAFLWLAVAGPTAYELYGGVNAEGAEQKANYFLKWRAIEDMKTAGLKVYDFNGRLNEGVSRFKDGFGPAETDYIGTYDYPLNQVGYRLWEHLWPMAKPVGRWVVGKLQKRQSSGS